MSNIVNDERSCYIGYIHNDVTEELLEELFTQVGPVTKVLIRKQMNTDVRFALVEFEDEESVLFAIETLNGVRLFQMAISVKPRNGTQQEELWKREKRNIEERQMKNPLPSRSGNNRRSYDNRRDSRDYRNDQYYMPPPPPPPPMYDHYNRDRQPHSQHHTPAPMPHTQFINTVLRQHSAPSFRNNDYNHRLGQDYESHQTPRRYPDNHSRNDWNGGRGNRQHDNRPYDNGRNRGNYNGDQRRSYGGGGGGGHGGNFSNRR